MEFTCVFSLTVGSLVLGERWRRYFAKLAFLHIGELAVKINKLLCIRSHVKLANRSRLIADYAVMATEDAAALFPGPDECFMIPIHQISKTVPEWGMALNVRSSTYTFNTKVCAPVPKTHELG